MHRRVSGTKREVSARPQIGFGNGMLQEYRWSSSGLRSEQSVANRWGKL